MPPGYDVVSVACDEEYYWSANFIINSTIVCCRDVCFIAGPPAATNGI